MGEIKTVIERQAMQSEYDGTKRKAAIFKDSGSEAPIENGMVVKISKILQRDLYEVVAPASTDKLEDLWIVTTPEVDADERKKSLSDFENKAGVPITIDKLMHGDVIGITAEGFNGTPAVGSVVCLGASGGVKLEAASSASSLGTKIGTIVDLANGFYGLTVE